MSKDFRWKIDQIISEKGFSMNKLNNEAGFGQGTLKAAYDGNREFSEDKLQKFLKKLNINIDWWRNCSGEIFIKKGTRGENTQQISEGGVEEVRAKVWMDLMEHQQDYYVTPRSIFKDYKIVPDKIIDALTKSNESEKEALHAKNELIINGYENQVKRLEDEKEKLEEQNKRLQEEISTLRRQIPLKSE